MIWNQDEILFCQYKGGYVVYVPTRKKLAYISQEEKCRLDKRDATFINGIIDGDYYDIEAQRAFEKDTIPWLVLNVSDVCNMNCKYCYLGGGEDSNSFMSFDEAKTIVDAYFKYVFEKYADSINIKSDLWITIAGGAEPMCNYKVVKDIVEYIKTFRDERISNDQINLCLVTNGFFDSEKALYVSENFDRVQLSFDGPQMIQDKYRVDKLGNSTFETVFNVANILYKSKVTLVFKSVLTQETEKNLDEILAFFADNFPGTRVMTSDVQVSGNALKHGIKSPCGNNIAIKKKYEKILNLSYDSEKRIKCFYCGACTSKEFIVSSNGIVKTCAHVDPKRRFEIGRISDGKLIIDEMKVNENLNRYSIEKEEKCRECIAKYICSGGCPHSREYLDSMDCTVWRKRFVCMVDNIIGEKVHEDIHI